MNSAGFLCDLCSEIFPKEIDLRKHVKEEHNIICYATAEYSSSGESDKTDLSSITVSDQKEISLKMKKSSMRRRRGVAREFTCDKCEYTTKVKASMKVHKLIHTVDCPYCQFKTVKQSSLKEHIMSDHQTQMVMPVMGGMGGRAVARTGEQFILGDIANQRLLNKITPSEDLLTGEFSYIGDIFKPGVIVSRETVILTSQALQFLTDNAKQKEIQEVEEEMVEIEEQQIEVIVSDEQAREIISQTDDSPSNNIYNWRIV